MNRKKQRCVTLLIFLAIVVFCGATADQIRYVAVKEVIEDAPFQGYTERTALFWTNYCRMTPSNCECGGGASPMKPLYYDGQLNKAARFHTDDIGDTQNCPFTHDSCDGTDPFTRIKNFYKAEGAENLACGQKSAKEAVNGWMCSDTHRENMFNQDWTEVGLGFTRGANGIMYAQNFGGRPDHGDTEPSITGTHYYEDGGSVLKFGATFYAPRVKGPVVATVTFVKTETNNKQTVTAMTLGGSDGYEGQGTYFATAPPDLEFIACDHYYFTFETEDGRQLRYPMKGYGIETEGLGDCPVKDHGSPKGDLEELPNTCPAPLDEFLKYTQRTTFFWTNYCRMTPKNCKYAEFEESTKPFRWNAKLGEAADFHTNDIGNTEGCAFSHASCDGTDPFTRIKKFYSAPGSENIASGQETSLQAVESWLCSDDHRKNMFKKAWLEIGIGFAKGTNGLEYFYAQNFGELTPPESHYPILGGTHVVEEGGTLIFGANIYGGDVIGGDFPEIKSAKVLVGEETHDLVLADTDEYETGGQGTYFASVPGISGDCQKYFFQFENANGEIIRYPLGHSLNTEGAGSCTVEDGGNAELLHMVGPCPDKEKLKTAPFLGYTERTAMMWTNYCRMTPENCECGNSASPMKALYYDGRLNEAARYHTDDIGNTTHCGFSHYSCDGTDAFTRIKRFYKPGSAVYKAGSSENIACGQKSAKEVVNAWMCSDDHRENIFNKDWTDVGLGFTLGVNGIIYAQNFGGKLDHVATEPGIVGSHYYEGGGSELKFGATFYAPGLKDKGGNVVGTVTVGGTKIEMALKESDRFDGADGQGTYFATAPPDLELTACDHYYFTFMAGGGVHGWNVTFRYPEKGYGLQTEGLGDCPVRDEGSPKGDVEGPADTCPEPLDEDLSYTERTTFFWTNYCRMSPWKCFNGQGEPSRAPLRWNQKLRNATEYHVNDLATTPGCEFSHTSCDGTDPFTRIRDSYNDTGSEIIATGQSTGLQAVESWMCSNGHRENMFSKEWVEIGTGFKKGPNGQGYFYAQTFGGQIPPLSRYPILSGTHVVDEEGGTMRFGASIFAQDEDDSIKSGKVLIGDKVHDLELAGSETYECAGKIKGQGTYFASMPVIEGACQEYYFKFENTKGEVFRYPLGHSLSTEGVGSCTVADEGSAQLAHIECPPEEPKPTYTELNLLFWTNFCRMTPNNCVVGCYDCEAWPMRWNRGLFLAARNHTIDLGKTPGCKFGHLSCNEEETGPFERIEVAYLAEEKRQLEEEKAKKAREIQEEKREEEAEEEANEARGNAGASEDLLTGNEEKEEEVEVEKEKLQVTENIGGGQIDAHAVLSCWIGSELHRNHMMNPNFTDVGLGFQGRGINIFKRYYLQTFAAGEHDEKYNTTALMEAMETRNSTTSVEEFMAMTNFTSNSTAIEPMFAGSHNLVPPQPGFTVPSLLFGLYYFDNSTYPVTKVHLHLGEEEVHEMLLEDKHRYGGQGTFFITLPLLDEEQDCVKYYFTIQTAEGEMYRYPEEPEEEEETAADKKVDEDDMGDGGGDGNEERKEGAEGKDDELSIYEREAALYLKTEGIGRCPVRDGGSAHMTVCNEPDADLTTEETHAQSEYPKIADRLLLFWTNICRMQPDIPLCGLLPEFEPLAPFYWDARLSKSAQKHVKVMEEEKCLSSDQCSDGPLVERLPKGDCHAEWLDFGELLSSKDNSPMAAVRAWMHGDDGKAKATIVDEQMNHIGSGEIGRYWDLTFASTEWKLKAPMDMVEPNPHPVVTGVHYRPMEKHLRDPSIVTFAVIIGGLPQSIGHGLVTPPPKQEVTVNATLAAGESVEDDAEEVAETEGASSEGEVKPAVESVESRLDKKLVAAAAEEDKEEKEREEEDEEEEAEPEGKATVIVNGKRYTMKRKGGVPVVQFREVYRVDVPIADLGMAETESKPCSVYFFEYEDEYGVLSRYPEEDTLAFETQGIGNCPLPPGVLVEQPQDPQSFEHHLATVNGADALRMDSLKEKDPHMLVGTLEGGKCSCPIKYKWCDFSGTNYDKYCKKTKEATPEAEPSVLSVHVKQLDLSVRSTDDWLATSGIEFNSGSDECYEVVQQFDTTSGKTCEVVGKKGVVALYSITIQTGSTREWEFRFTNLFSNGAMMAIDGVKHDFIPALAPPAPGKTELVDNTPGFGLGHLVLGGSLATLHAGLHTIQVLGSFRVGGIMVAQFRTDFFKADKWLSVTQANLDEATNESYETTTTETPFNLQDSIAHPYKISLSYFAKMVSYRAMAYSHPQELYDAFTGALDTICHKYTHQLAELTIPDVCGSLSRYQNLGFLFQIQFEITKPMSIQFKFDTNFNEGGLVIMDGTVQAQRLGLQGLGIVPGTSTNDPVDFKTPVRHLQVGMHTIVAVGFSSHGDRRQSAWFRVAGTDHIFQYVSQVNLVDAIEKFGTAHDSSYL